MDLQLGGKRALVTGSSSGIGEAIAKSLAAEGAAVVVHGRRQAEANRVASEIAAAGGKAVVAMGDLSSDAGADAVAKVVNDALGGADILVNNAGAYPQTPWLESTAADWTGVYNQNVGSMVRMITRLVPGMKQRGWGRVISLASVVATMPFPGGAGLRGHQERQCQPRSQPGQGVGRHGHYVQRGEPRHDCNAGRRGDAQGDGPAVRASARRFARAGEVCRAKHGAQPQRAAGTCRRHRVRGRLPGQPAGRLHQRRKPPRGRRNRADSQLAPAARSAEAPADGAFFLVNSVDFLLGALEGRPRGFGRADTSPPQKVQ